MAGIEFGLGWAERMTKLVNLEGVTSLQDNSSEPKELARRRGRTTQKIEMKVVIVKEVIGGSEEAAEPIK